MTKIQVERSALERKGTSSLTYESSWRRKVKLQKYRQSGNVKDINVGCLLFKKVWRQSQLGLRGEELEEGGFILLTRHWKDCGWESVRKKNNR